ncbi:MAG: hypothetical protein L0220_11660 [Acidobacteria bacterium]|nr:hypothetical protein [Acidobacteriota bacterium]
MNCFARVALCLPLVCLLVDSQDTFAQKKGRQNLSVEKKTETEKEPVKGPEAIDLTSLFPYRPIGSWADKRFIFLPGPKASEGSQYEDFTSRLIRKNFQGKIAKVISVSDFGGRTHLEFEVEETGERYRARTLPNKETIKGLALVEDLEIARREWAGKTLWCKQIMLATYDEQNDLAGNIQIKRFEAVKVIDVLPGWDEEKPVRFLLETADGKRGFLDINLSGTNVFNEVRHLHRFGNSFLIDDPKKIYKWSTQTWRMIETGKILAGMTMEQVKMSWGEPDKITRTETSENWVYPTGTLIFKKGVLVANK